MGAQPSLLVSADEYLAAVRVHADRVHDLLRRLGCGPDTATEITTVTALDLLETLVERPETVPDLVGWWAHRALRLGRRAARDEQSHGRRAGSATSVLAGSSGEAQVREALAELPARERTAVLLRDGYDLPPYTVGVALGGADDVVSCYARGRLDLVAHYDNRSPPDLAAHPGRPPADLDTLTCLADGSLLPAAATSLRRHVHGCPLCEDVVETSAKGRRLAAGLPVIALADEDRDVLLDHAEERARQLLPTAEEVLLAHERAADEPLLGRSRIITSLVAAVLLGVIAGYLTRPGPARTGIPLALGTPTPAATASSTPRPRVSRSSPAPSTTARTVASRSSTPPPPPNPAGSSPQSSTVAIQISPAQGPNGTTVTVTGTGWTPGTAVSVQFVDSAGTATSASQAVASAAGTFTTTVTAQDPSLLPTSCTVSAAGGGRHASAPFQRTL